MWYFNEEGRKKHGMNFSGINLAISIKSVFLAFSIFRPQLTCGIDIDLSPYNVKDAVASTLVTSSKHPDIDNMEVTPLHISIEDLRETNKKVYVEFKLT